MKNDMNRKYFGVDARRYVRQSIPANLAALK